MGRPSHKPTEERRATVKAMTGYGIKQDDIAKVLGIHDETLRIHYAHELAVGAAEANAQMLQSLFWLGTKGKNVAAAIFWAKTRCGFREVTHIANGEEGKPLLLQVVTGVTRADD